MRTSAQQEGLSHHNLAGLLALSFLLAGLVAFRAVFLELLLDDGVGDLTERLNSSDTTHIEQPLPTQLRLFALPVLWW